MFEPAATLHLSLNYCSNCCRSAEQRLQILSLSLDKNIWIQFCSNHRLSYTVQSIHSQCIEAEIWVHFKIDWSIQMFSQNSFNHWFLFSTKKSGWVREQLERERGDAELSFTTTKEWKLFSELHHTAKLPSENWNLITRGFVSLDSLNFLSVN